jgi:hypothetical protein
MKVRIKGNSLRYRLTKSDFTNLLGELALTECSEFLSNTFVYGIEVTANEELSADFKDNNIILQLPSTMLLELVKTDRVGFSGHSGAVSLLIEKDFTCLDNVEEDQSDHFPNPLLQ